MQIGMQGSAEHVEVTGMIDQHVDAPESSRGGSKWPTVPNQSTIGVTRRHAEWPSARRAVPDVPPLSQALNRRHAAATWQFVVVDATGHVGKTTSGAAAATAPI